MSPARSKRQPVPHRRSRADIVQAVAVAAGIVITTAILVWLLRPGPPGIPATGGIMNRQPRASWLVSAALGLAGLATWWILRGSRRLRPRAKILLPIALVVVLVAAVGGGIAWPGGLLRHDVAPAPAPSTTTTTTAKGATTTTSPASTTTPKSGGSGGSGSTTQTTEPSATTTPATGSGATTPTTSATTITSTGSP